MRMHPVTQQPAGEKCGPIKPEASGHLGCRTSNPFANLGGLCVKSIRLTPRTERKERVGFSVLDRAGTMVQRETVRSA